MSFNNFIDDEAVVVLEEEEEDYDDEAPVAALAPCFSDSL